MLLIAFIKKNALLLLISTFLSGTNFFMYNIYNNLQNKIENINFITIRIYQLEESLKELEKSTQESSKRIDKSIYGLFKMTESIYEIGNTHQSQIIKAGENTKELVKALKKILEAHHSQIIELQTHVNGVKDVLRTLLR